MRTIAYVDGYNLYYGLLRKSRHKWLDLYALFKDHLLDDAADLIEVRYYTAPVLGRMTPRRSAPPRANSAMLTRMACHHQTAFGRRGGLLHRYPM